MKHLLRAIAVVTRWSHWSTGAVTMLMSLGFLVGLDQRARFEDFGGRMALLLLPAAAHTAFGYMVNNWGDRALDRAQGRANPFNAMPVWKGRAWLVGAGLAALLTALPFVHGAGFLVAWGAWMVATLAYSLPPLRLKTRGGWGLLANCAAQYTLPAIILLLVLGGLTTAWNVLLVSAITVSGEALEIGHQRYDRDADAQAGANTFAVRRSANQLDWMYGAALLLDVAAIATLTACVAGTMLTFQQPWLVALGLTTGFGVTLLMLVTLPPALKAVSVRRPIEPHFHAVTHLPSKLLHQIVPNAILPVVLALGLTFLDARYALLLGVFLLWRVVLYRPNWRLLLAVFRRPNA